MSAYCFLVFIGFFNSCYSTKKEVVLQTHQISVVYFHWFSNARLQASYVRITFKQYAVIQVAHESYLIKTMEKEEL